MSVERPKTKTALRSTRQQKQATTAAPRRDPLAQYLWPTPRRK
jgi:hypothetical protein